MHKGELEHIVQKHGFCIRSIPTVMDSVTFQKVYIVDEVLNKMIRMVGISSDLKSLIVKDYNNSIIYRAYGDSVSFDNVKEINRISKNDKISCPLRLIGNQVNMTDELKSWLKFNGIEIEE